MTADKYLYQSD